MYAASKAIGPRELKDEDARDTARRAYQKNPRISSAKIGKATGRSRQAVDSYINDLRARHQLDQDIKIYKMNSLGIPQERIARRLGLDQKSIHNHLGELPKLAFLLNGELKKGFSVNQVAERHGWPESLVWAIKMQGKNDIPKYRELQWGLRAWDYWYWTDCDRRFGDEWPGRIPAQLIAHILYYFSKENDLVIDPMAGGGVVPDTCLAFNRRCWSFDMVDRIDERPEIEPHFWDKDNLKWPVSGKAKPDLIIFDPPYFSKKAKEYEEDSISNLTRGEYMDFLERFFRIALENSKKGTRLVMINADWRDFQGTPALEEDEESAILIIDYGILMRKVGWAVSHVMQAPMSSERFQGGTVSKMQNKKILGVTCRNVVVGRKK